MKTAVIIVLYNTPFKEQLRLEQEFFKLGVDEIFLPDNTHTGLGYAAAINAVLRSTLDHYDLFCIANPDISLNNLHKKRWREAASYFDIWGYPFEQHGLRYYGGKIDRLRMSGGLLQSHPKTRYAPVDFVSGSLICVKKSVFEKIGVFDESFGMYYEDVEFCTRAHRQGLKVGIDTAQSYVHYETSDLRPEKKKMLARNRLRFLMRYGGPAQKLYELLRFPKTLLEDGFFFL
jgi:GT2 family glycosyltransferase